MADSKPDQTTVASSAAAPGSSVEPTGDEHGRTTIAESVVAKIASLAAQEVSGVDSLGGAISGAIAGVVGRVRGSEHKTAGVGVEVGIKQAAVDLTMKVRYPFPIHEVADAVRQNVTDRIESMTGLDVVEVNIAVTDLAFDADETSTDTAPDRVA
ncbi:MAG: Asp23/Gls24 family envelope stress response protein [Actinomycetota bacterium]|nr:Asp23/Gls24 family envelope stress response protein [Actinomycetota bacterium]